MSNPPNFSNNRNIKYIPVNFQNENQRQKEKYLKELQNYKFDQGFQPVQPYQYRLQLPQINTFQNHSIPNQDFIQGRIDPSRIMHNVQPSFSKTNKYLDHRKEFFVKDNIDNRRQSLTINEKSNDEIPIDKDIRIQYLENYSDKSGEDLRNEMNQNYNDFETLEHKKNEETFFKKDQPKIKIISPHLVQYFKKHKKQLENKKIKDAQINLRTNQEGAVLIKTKMDSPKTIPKVSFSKKIKKAKLNNDQDRTQYNMWTINQHFNIGNINPPMMQSMYAGMQQTKQSFPIHNPAEDYHKFKDIFDTPQNSSEKQSPLDPGDVQNNWNLIYQMNLEDKLYLDVSTNNIYLKIDNKNDQRFKHFEGIHQYSKELKDIESQLVPVSESLLPNHLLKLKQGKSKNLEKKSVTSNDNDLLKSEFRNVNKVDILKKESLTEKLKKTQKRRKQNLLKSNQKEKKIYSTSYRKKFQQGCKCSKSKCLRLHCLCFKQGKFCDGLCGCTDCYNSENYAGLVEKVKNATKDINSKAFESKFLEINRNGEMIKITKGCTCMKNNCLKNYCECKKNGLACTTLCKCDQCFNDHISLTHEEVSRMHTKNSRKKKKIIFQTKDNKTLGFESKEIINKTNNS
jgi:hypothetical protein